MKKIILLALCCLLLCGCSNKDFSFSELELEDFDDTYGYDILNGTIQNNTNKDYSLVKITLILKSGDIEEKCSFTINDFKAKEKIQLEDQWIFDCPSKLDNYEIVRKEVKTYE